ncbi:hydrolase, alpha/beta fold family protein [Aspergillus steynii IBT 23096]|uniref:Hydrolase, alpha/beta fold family protein n=1 Tax=Aspergillus steynii IBT 23096 TaxID=1392250 RepID=A0A2I2FTV7_9EURO|nr:hydrolase, alpha/beta fold family protein [Aspergillus steynii IBT 23096]PLB44044.1 hydrolase, alpha/beta fold family protein [Aspergillus steynii IBT 23096]
MDRTDDAVVSMLETPFQSSAALLPRHRKAAPSRSHSANPSTVDPASPEVISSLISSLSTISAPLQSHFDNVPRIGSETGPSSPVVLPSDQHSIPDQRPPTEHGFGVSYGAPPASDEPPNTPFLHPDDAAVAPVIRMARAPPSPKSNPGPDPSSILGRPTSRGSYTSSKAAYEDYAFGMITAEPGPRLSTAPSIASSGSRKSLKNQLVLLKKGSREFGGDKDKRAERLRKTSSYNDSLKHNIPRSRASLRSLYSMADVAEEGRPGPSGMVPTTEERTVSRSSSKERQSLQYTPESAPGTPGGIGSGRVIPTRESSLRHSFSSSPKHHRSVRHARRYSSSGSKEMKADSSAAGSSNEAEQVTKRIQQLKDQQQKIKTELEIDDSPDKPVAESPSQHTLPPQRLDEGERLTEPAKRQNDCKSVLDFDESAPSPAVMTGKSRSVKRTSPILASRPTNVPLQPSSRRQSFEKFDSTERIHHRQSMESSTPSRHPNHFASGQPSPGHGSIVDERPSSADSIDLAVFDYVSSSKLTQKVVHPATGRAIAFSEVGDPKGYVVLCCLGMGLTRYLMAFYDELARSLHLRLITLDRPGVGESGPHVSEAGTPLSWPVDDVAIVCNHLKVTKFSILAHSAGAIYALATALRIPQHIRGRIHLLAPWIPPSQLSSIGSPKAPVPTNAVPYSQRILRALPTSILKVANSSFMSATSASITSSLPKSPRRARRRATVKDTSSPTALESNGAQRLPSKIHQQGADFRTLQTIQPPSIPNASGDKKPEVTANPAPSTASEERERQTDYDTRLTHKIWELATANANPAVDLLVCLERRQPIGFRYVDITRNVVIHHGSRDTRVPVDNVRWLGQTMRRCEVRVLEGEGHGLMASAGVMGNVLMEIAKEWEDWMIVVQGKRRGTMGPRSGIAVQA